MLHCLRTKWPDFVLKLFPVTFLPHDENCAVCYNHDFEFLYQTKKAEGIIIVITFTVLIFASKKFLEKFHG